MELGAIIAIIIAILVVLMGVMYALYWMGMISFVTAAASGMMCGSNATGEPVAVTAGFMCCTNTVNVSKDATGICGSNSYAKLVAGCKTGGATLGGYCCLSTYNMGEGGWCNQCLEGSTGAFGFSCCNSTIGTKMAASGCSYCTTGWWGWTTTCP